MRFVSSLLMFGGYMLVYAAIANHGKFATEPWAGLFADAYPASSTPPAAGATGTGSGALAGVTGTGSVPRGTTVIH